MKFLSNRKLATRISIIMTVIFIAGMLLLWRIVSDSAASIVENDITNQMTDAVESRATIINEDDHKKRGVSEDIPRYDSGAEGADKSGHYEVTGIGQHDTLHVLPDL